MSLSAFQLWHVSDTLCLDRKNLLFLSLCLRVLLFFALKRASGATPGVKSDDFVSKTTVKQELGKNVVGQVESLKKAGLLSVQPKQRRLKSPKVVTDIREEWDKQGNITRTTIKYITEVDGVTKREERNVEFIPAKK